MHKAIIAHSALGETASLQDIADALTEESWVDIAIPEEVKENEKVIEDYFIFFLNKVLMIYVATEELQDAFLLTSSSPISGRYLSRKRLRPGC